MQHVRLFTIGVLVGGENRHRRAVRAQPASVMSRHSPHPTPRDTMGTAGFDEAGDVSGRQEYRGSGVPVERGQWEASDPKIGQETGPRGMGPAARKRAWEVASRAGRAPADSARAGLRLSVLDRVARGMAAAAARHTGRGLVLPEQRAPGRAGEWAPTLRAAPRGIRFQALGPGEPGAFLGRP